MRFRPDFAEKWLDQWNNAARELQRVHDAELRALSTSGALAATDALLEMAGMSSPPAARWRYSGLVEQQRLFMRSRSR